MPSVSTTSLKLDARIKKRMQKLAGARNRSAHWLMREAIQHYYADKGKYPERLDALAEHKYLRRIPVDPVTEKADSWIVVAPADNLDGGVYDVKSGAEGKTREGVPYAEL